MRVEHLTCVIVDTSAWLCASSATAFTVVVVIIHRVPTGYCRIEPGSSDCTFRLLECPKCRSQRCLNRKSDSWKPFGYRPTGFLWVLDCWWRAIDAVKNDIAPINHSVLHTHRSRATGRAGKGGGLALIHNSNNHSSILKLPFAPTAFELQLVGIHVPVSHITVKVAMQSLSTTDVLQGDVLGRICWTALSDWTWNQWKTDYLRWF